MVSSFRLRTVNESLVRLEGLGHGHNCRSDEGRLFRVHRVNREVGQSHMKITDRSAGALPLRRKLSDSSLNCRDRSMIRDEDRSPPS